MSFTSPKTKLQIANEASIYMQQRKRVPQDLLENVVGSFMNDAATVHVAELGASLSLLDVQVLAQPKLEVATAYNRTGFKKFMNWYNASKFEYSNTFDDLLKYDYKGHEFQFWSSLYDWSGNEHNFSSAKTGLLVVNEAGKDTLANITHPNLVQHG